MLTADSSQLTEGKLTLRLLPKIADPPSAQKVSQTSERSERLSVWAVGLRAESVRTWGRTRAPEHPNTLTMSPYLNTYNDTHVSTRSVLLSTTRANDALPLVANSLLASAELWVPETSSSDDYNELEPFRYSTTHRKFFEDDQLDGWVSVFYLDLYVPN